MSATAPAEPTFATLVRDAARALAARGWQVFPLHSVRLGPGPEFKFLGCTCDDPQRDCKPGKHPRHDKKLLPSGVRSASDDPALIGKWLEKWPESNVGVRTGPESNVFVVGPDGDEGNAQFDALCRDHGATPEEVSNCRSRTQSGGRHYFFSYPADRAGLGNYANHRGLKIDTRAANGYVVAPPSSGEAGDYVWELVPPDGPLLPLPEWLAEWCRKPKRGPSAPRESSRPSAAGPVDAHLLKRAGKWLAKAEPAIQGQEGNSKLYTAAVGVAYGFDLPDEQAFDLLMGEYNPRCVPPWSEGEIRKAIRDANAKPHDKPRGHLRDKERPADPKPHFGSGHRKQAGPDRGVDATPREPDRPGPAVVAVGTDEHRVNAEAEAALAAEPDIYQRGGLLVSVTHQPQEPDDSAAVRRPAGAAALLDIRKPTLRERLSRCVKFVKRSGAGDDLKEAAAHPPGWCVEAIHAREYWPPVRRLDSVVPHPAFLPDGTVLAADGYDRGSRLYVALEPGLDLAVPPRPARDDAGRAVAELRGLVCDFPFETEAHFSAWLAGLLTPLAWFSFDGPAPMFLIDGNVRGIGKGLLADAAAIIATGRRFGVMSYTPDREEMRKKITALAVEGDRLVLLDNLAGRVGSDVLDSALTSDRWKDRVLSTNKTYDGPLAVTWFGTGNNVQLSADMSRRVCHIRLESADERPETKGGFKHPKLRLHTTDSRGRYLSCALTILRAWHVAGRPTHGLEPWGSYESWSGVVREALVFAGAS